MVRMECLRLASPARAAVVALGNPYRGDDGVGPALLRLLRRDGLPIDLIEAIHDGFRLAEAVCGYERVLIVDAAPWLSPGEVVRFRLGELPGRAGYLHGLGLGAALEALAMAGERVPEVEILAIGIPPVCRFEEGLSSEVERALPRALAEVERWLNG